MKKVLSQFNKTITVDELIKTIQAELKASNISSSAADITFKNYPTDANEEEGITSDILNSNLNTIVFDTETSKVTIYITAEAGVFAKKEDLEEVKTISDNLQITVTSNANDITELQNKYEAINTKQTASEEKQNEIEEKIGNIEGKIQPLNQKYELANAGINELKNKNTEIEGKLNDYALKTKQVELENKITQLTEKQTELEAEIEKLKTPKQEGDV